MRVWQGWQGSAECRECGVGLLSGKCANTIILAIPWPAQEQLYQCSSLQLQQHVLYATLGSLG
jgi:hypothetical protein